MPALQEDVRAAIASLKLDDMRLAQFLARVRNLGSSRPSGSETFAEASAHFGTVMLGSASQWEIVGGLIGQFWNRAYGIRGFKHGYEFRDFADPNYTKTVTNFWFADYREGNTLLRTETRVHSLGPWARRSFALYWALVGFGVRLYMASVLRGIRKSAIRHATPARPVAMARR